MKKGLFRLRAIGLSVAILACSGASAHAATLIDPASLPLIPNTASCATPVFSQPFAPWGDTNLYTLVPGQTASAFNGSGWILTTGARVVTSTVAGHSSTALEIPLGGVAISPPMCVTDAYPTARTMVAGPAGQGVTMSVLYSYHGLWGNPIATGTIRAGGTAWSPSPVVNIHPGPAVGWQWARFALVGTSLTGSTRLYSFYVDPRMK